MIYQVNHSNWLLNMQQVCLPLVYAYNLDYPWPSLVPADRDHLGLHHNSTGPRPCSLSPFYCRRLGVVDGAATGFQLSTGHSHY